MTRQQQVSLFQYSPFLFFLFKYLKVKHCPFASSAQLIISQVDSFIRPSPGHLLQLGEKPSIKKYKREKKNTHISNYVTTCRHQPHLMCKYANKNSLKCKCKYQSAIIDNKLHSGRKYHLCYRQHFTNQPISHNQQAHTLTTLTRPTHAQSIYKFK